MNILLAASEAAPFFSTGNMGDMAGNLARFLARQKINVRVALPLYGELGQEWKKYLRYAKNFTVPVSWRNQYCGLFEFEADGVLYYFLDNEYYFKRPGFYGYYDDGERFAFFSRAVLETLNHCDFAPDVIHCNDWQTALIPVYLKLYYRRFEKLAKTKTVFTIHDAQFQGQYGPEIAEWVLGIGRGDFRLVEYDGIVNYTKGGIETADLVSTVSPSYAREILDPWYGCGLDRILHERDFKLRGILSGIDEDEYNPLTDMLIPAQYDAESFETGKAVCKEKLRKTFGLDETDTPVVGMATHLAGGKGIDLLVRAAEEILDGGLQLALLCAGDAVDYRRFFAELAARKSGRCAVMFGYFPDVARTVYAGSDMFLMPSRTEPCGLAQMHALRYGAIPVVRKTGGLGDTVAEGDNGFVFSGYNADEMTAACFRARDMWKNREEWAKMVRRAMGGSHDWSVPAKKYAGLYKEAIALW
jgi:starch synthase